MANSTSSDRKDKADENNNGSCLNEMGRINSGSSMKDAAGPRRSIRETSSKKMTPSPSSTRKSERLGKSTPLNPPVRRKSERVEKQKMPNSLRRSKRTKNRSDIASSGSKGFDSLAQKQKKKKKHKSVKKLTFEAEKAENEECEGETSQVKRKRMNARAYRAMIKKKPKIDCPEETNGKGNLIPGGGNNVEGKIDERFKGSNLVCKEAAKNEMLPSDDAKELANLSAIKVRVEIEATFAAEISEKGVDCSPPNDVSIEIQSDDGKICLICQCGGQLLFCDGKECDGCYHFSCLEPPMVDAPLGVWHCNLCLKKKIEFGVYSVSEGVESIWDTREVKVSHADGLTTEKHFLVKYKGLAHVHNRWVSESQLLLEAPPLLLEKFNQKDQALKWKLEWSIPHRLLQKRALIFANDGHPRSGQAVGNSQCHYEWLVKWHGLGYEDASWELDNAPFLRSLEGQRLIKDYEDRHQRAKRVPLSSKADKKLDRISSFSKLSQTPGGFPPGFGVNNLDAVNKLREHWHKGQNAVIFDDHDRMVKVVAFILSLDSNTCQPFLIISTSAALHLWEDEFSCWAPSLNVIIYGGNKEIRRSIRKLEFYGEGGCLLFQVLIVLPEIIIEDLEVLEGIEFEAILVDECQCSKISSYSKQIKMLKTDLWILLLSGQLKDSVVEYHDILALLHHRNYNEKNDDLISNSSDIGQLKDKLSSFVAYRCKSDSFRFVEYWIPVNISNVQLEQYCAALLSNSSILRSQSKSHVVGALHDILVTTRKCCNHPYLVDESLQSLLIKDLPPAEILDVGIKASAKLQLLDSMLMELKKQGLRVLILFQFLGGSGKVSIGDILDDLIRQRFGPDSYERIDKGVLNSKKQSALKMFNNKDHGRFVFLLEANACHQSIKLSSVDTIIIFDSDWNPLNDIRSLQKITLDSQLEQIKIFRLYSSFTVEERALVLAKQDRPLDTKFDISWSTSHTLLMWGASSLFDDLKAFHDGKTDFLSVDSLSGQLSLKHALHEFSFVLKQNGEDNDARDCSFLLKVKQNGVKYHPNFSLLGEWKFKSLDLEPCHLFWTKVLEGKNPRWKYSCGSSQRSRKRVQHFDSGNRPDLENEEVVKKRSKLINNADQPYSKHEGEQLSARNKEGNSGEPMERPQGNDVEFLKARKSRNEQRSLHLSLKSEIAKLCEILHVPDNVRRMADEFLEYVMNNHHVNSTLPKSILEAFQISLCWTAAALVKHKIDHEASLMLAKQNLKFGCRKDEANLIYSMLRCLKNIFLHRTGNYNVTGSPKASGSELSGKNYSCMGLALEVELAKKDVSKSIKEIQKKCQKKLRKLLLKHQEEKKKLNATYEEKRADLEKKYKIESAVIRSSSPDDVMRSEKLKALDIEYTGRIEDLKHQHQIHLKDLEDDLLKARQTLQNWQATWVEDVKSWAQDELLNTLPLKERENGIAYLRTSEQVEPDSNPKNRCLMSNLVAEGTNFDGIVEAMTGNGIGLSRTPEITSPVALQCSSPVEAQTPPVEPASAYEGPDRAQDACDSRGKMISVHSHSKEHNVNGATCMMNEGEGHNIFYDGRREKILLEDSDKDITVDPPSSRELISYGSPLNVSDRELSRQCESPLFPDQQTSDGVSLHMHDGQVPLEVPGTSREIAQCYNGRECRTEVVVLDRTVTSEEQEQMHSTMNNNNLSQALQDSQASLLTSPRMVDKDATVGERQNSSGPAELVSGPVDVIPADQSNPQSVMEPLEQVQQLPSAESLASNQGTGGEMQISASQVEAVSSPTDALPAGQFSHDPVVEPLEQVQQLASAESLASNPDTSGEMLNSSQRVEPVCCQIDVTQSNGLNHESLVGELLQQMQQFPPAESPNSNHYPSMATGIELRSNSEDSLSGRIPPAQMEVANQTVVHPASNSDLVSHAPLGAFRTQSLDTRNVFTPSEINNHLRQTATQSMNRMHSPLVIDPLKNELDRLRKESEQTLKYYEDTKLQLKSDCEREIEEIRRKYDIKLQESEVEFQLKRKTLDTSLNLVQMNQAWAEAFRSKCMDLRVSGASGTQQDPSFAQQLVWFSRQQRDMRPPLVASPPLGPPASTLQHFATAAGSQTMVPLVSSMQPFSPPASSQILGTPMPAPASSSPMVLPISTTTISQTMAPPLLAAYNAAPRPPHISSIPPLANHQAGSGFRTTPPHLQHYRPSTSLPDSGLPTPAHGVSSQQAPNSIPVIPSLPNHSRPTLSTNISDPRNRVHRPEIPAALTSPNLSAREPAMDGNCQPGLNLRNSLLRSSNVTSLQQSEFGTSSSVQDDSVRPAMSADIVCLSDDD